MEEIDKEKIAKLDPMAKAFMEFFEKNYNVTFVDVEENDGEDICEQLEKGDL